MIQLENNQLCLTINEDNGSISSLYDKRKKKEYLLGQFPGDSFRLETNNGIITAFKSFSIRIDESAPDDRKIILRWEVEPGLIVTGTIIASATSHELYFYSEVSNQTGESVIGVEFPVIPNIQAITEKGTNDFVAHSFATGFLIHNPLKHFEVGGMGFRHTPYPESFSGAAMQFFTYYGLGEGGLYFAAHDGKGYAKWLNFYKNINNLLEASFFHGSEDIGPGKGISVEYPVVIRAQNGEGWYEAADLYKQWAINQFWCKKGKLTDQKKEDYASWLYDEMGVATFGINAQHDRSDWFNKYHEYIETPMFHILGPDWVQQTQSFGNGVPGGMDDWLPARFHPNNIKTLKAYGDKYAPFEFDYLYDIHGADGEQGRKSLQKFPEEGKIKSIDKYQFPLICPVDSYVRDLHIRRDERLQAENDVDSIYYDISANNILKVCLDPSHGHPVGAGRQVTMAYRENYVDTKDAMMKKAMRYVPMGTEMMNEVFLDVIDYYQARAGGRPAAPLEGWPFRDLIVKGKAELIPMFTYVYNEYGALRLDGWGKLVEETGSLFYFTAARTYLWGGLYELNYEYSPMESIEGKENDPNEHYYIFDPRGYQMSSERARYVAKLANIRTGIGNKYLSYGKMVRPLTVECDQVELEWFHYNHDKHSEDYNQSGTYEVDSVVHSAWQYQNESVGFFFANVTDKDRKITVVLDMSLYVVPSQVHHVKQVLNGQMKELIDIDPNGIKQFELNIPKKETVMLEVY